MDTSLTLTTINMPHVIENILENAGESETENLQIVIIGDLKTPLEIEDYVKKVDKSSKAEIVYLSVADQEKLFSKHTNLWNHIPVNSFARRNYADIYAADSGALRIIRIDDDNFPYEPNFIQKHEVVGSTMNLDTISSSKGWFNVCETLTDINNVEFYPRGYPVAKRWIDHDINVNKKDVKIGVNAGLWLGDPDVDAFTRLTRPIDAITYDNKYGDYYALEKGTYCPINTQNTSYMVELLPTMFVSPFAGRYDDILSGYFQRSIMDNFDLSVTYGIPLMKQDRNPHNIFDDMSKEILGGKCADEICKYLQDFKYSGSSIADCYSELVDQTIKDIDQFPSKDFLLKILEGMKIWSESFNK